MSNYRKALVIIFIFVYQHASSDLQIPTYTKGPRIVYYLTGMCDRLFTHNGIAANQDNWSLPYRRLRDMFENKGYIFRTSLPERVSEGDTFLIFWHNMPNIHMCQRLARHILNRIIVIVTEPPHTFPNNYNFSLHKYFNRILTWDDTLVDNIKYFKYYFVQASLDMIENVVPFDNKKLCTLVAGNKKSTYKGELYSKRREAIHFFEKYHPHEFDFYGIGWDEMSYQTYKGKVNSKTSVLKKYKFSICYENIANQSGYITEKIFGVFISGCVPVYWGAQNITDYIPSNCFIDRRKFRNLHELYSFISTMQADEYNQYLNNIRTFLRSDQAQKFSIDSFVSSLVRIAFFLS